MSSGRKTDPTQLKPRFGLQPPRAQSADDPSAVRAAELEEKLLQAQAKLTQLAQAMAAIERAEAARGGGAERDEKTPRSHAAFSLQVRDWDKATKFVVAFTALLSTLAFALGLKNQAEKAPVPAVDKIDRKVDDVALIVEGRSDQKGAASKGESLSERVAKLEAQVRPIEASRCARDQWLAQVLDRVGAHGVKVEGCPSPAPIEAEPAGNLPGRPRPPRDWVVKTPLPSP